MNHILEAEKRGQIGRRRRRRTMLMDYKCPGYIEEGHVTRLEYAKVFEDD
jgi:hypothetical protein